MGKIVFVGRPEGAAARWADVAEHWTSRDLLTRPLDRLEAIVLFLQAIGELDPVAVPVRLRPHRDRTVICVSAWKRPHLARLCLWHDQGFTDVHPDQLAARLLGASSDPRPHLPLDVWFPLPVEPGSDAERVLIEMTATDELTVDAAARAAGCHRRTLGRWCQRWFHTTPEDILELFVVAIIRRARCGGATVDRCADIAAYAEARCVRRVFARLGIELPGAGSREPGAGSREPGAGSREPGAGRIVNCPKLSGPMSQTVPLGFPRSPMMACA